MKWQYFGSKYGLYRQYPGKERAVDASTGQYQNYSNDRMLSYKSQGSFLP